MDWTAVGSIAAIAAAVVAYIQYRHTTKPIQPAIISPTPPKLHYLIKDYRFNLDLFDALKVGYDDERWADLDAIRDKLKSLHLACVVIKNQNKFAVSRVACELSVKDVLINKVESTKTLAKSAVKISQENDVIHINIEEFPPEEEVEILFVANRSFGWKLNPLNAAVEFKMERN